MKILITGASGFLGWNLCQEAKANWQVYGTYFSQPVTIPQTALYKIDLRDYEQLKQFVATIKPDAVVHTAAASKPNFCQTNPEESYSINVTASVNLACICAEYNIPLAFTSTDLVFDGKNPPYPETNPVSPICYYGEQKVTAEREMLAIYPATAICRMPLMFGLPSPVANSFLQGFITNLKAGKELDLFTDEFRTPVSAIIAAKGLLLAIEKRVNGLLHLGGKERISRYEFGLLLAEILNCDRFLIRSVKQQEIVMVAPRSPDTSLDSSKAFTLGYQPRSIREELIDLVNC